MNDAIDLKPCPFCGGEARIIQGVTRRFGKSFNVQCSECGLAGMAHPSSEDAAAAWNRRYERTCEMRKVSWDNGECTWGCACSACGYRFEHEYGLTWEYCPNCGAKIAGDGHDD